MLPCFTTPSVEKVTICIPIYISWRAQIVSDLRTLRELADALLRYDCVTFLTLLDTLRLSEGRGSVWLLHAAAHTIFEEVRLSICPSATTFLDGFNTLGGCFETWVGCQHLPGSRFRP